MEQASVATVNVDAPPKRKRGRPRKAVAVQVPAPSVPPPRPPLELQPGEVEQSNCVARRDHLKIATEGGNCDTCGYPGPWIGLKEKPKPVALSAENSPVALFHLAALLDMIAAKNANDTPIGDVCIVCDGESEHAGSGICSCPCHPARAFLVEQTRL